MIKFSYTHLVFAPPALPFSLQLRGKKTMQRNMLTFILNSLSSSVE